MKPVFYIKEKPGAIKNADAKRRGRAVSHSVSSLLCLVLKKEISENTPIYSPKDKKWLSISKRKEFQIFFSGKKNWTLLKKVNDKFVQSGPYSKKGIQKFLAEGIASDQDFAWKEGWDHWRRLSVCEDFHTRLDFTIEDSMDELSLNYKDKGLRDKKARLLPRPPISGPSWNK